MLMTVQTETWASISQTLYSNLALVYLIIEINWKLTTEVV